MRINGRDFRTIWLDDDGHTVVVIDQTRLPFEFALYELRTLEQAAEADLRVAEAKLRGCEDASDGIEDAGERERHDPDPCCRDA